MKALLPNFVNGKRPELEVNWNSAAAKGKMMKLTFGTNTAVFPIGDLRTLLFMLEDDIKQYSKYADSVQYQRGAGKQHVTLKANRNIRKGDNVEADVDVLI